MKALVMEGPKRSKVVEVPDLTPGAGQLLVKVKYTGICMSEWHPWEASGPGGRLGHEPLGIVAAIGEGVQGFKVGDRVTGLADSPTYAEYCTMKQEGAVLVPENLRDEDAVGEPLSCLVSVASQLRMDKPGDTVAVVGAGYMGLGIMTLLRLKGAGRVISVDPRPEARENALRFGADEVYSPDEVPAKYIVRDWDDTIFERGLQVVSEFTGVESALRLAGDMTGIHGTLGVGGWHQGGERTVDFRLWGWKAITVINTHERRFAFQVSCCRNGLGMLSSGVWNYKGVANNIYSLSEFDKANEDLVNKPKGYIKGLVNCSEW